MAWGRICSCQGRWELWSLAGRQGAQVHYRKKKGVQLLGVISSLCYRGQTKGKEMDEKTIKKIIMA